MNQLDQDNLEIDWSQLKAVLCIIALFGLIVAAMALP